MNVAITNPLPIREKTEVTRSVISIAWSWAVDKDIVACNSGTGDAVSLEMCRRKIVKRTHTLALGPGQVSEWRYNKDAQQAEHVCTKSLIFDGSEYSEGYRSDDRFVDHEQGKIHLQYS